MITCLAFRTTAPMSMTTLASVTVTDPKEDVLEATNATTMLTVLMQKRIMNVPVMMTTLVMDSHAQVIEKTRLVETTRPLLRYTASNLK
jgi:hypothetical protein